MLESFGKAFGADLPRGKIVSSALTAAAADEMQAVCFRGPVPFIGEEYGLFFLGCFHEKYTSSIRFCFFDQG
jgi:hypothetical protein